MGRLSSTRVAILSVAAQKHNMPLSKEVISGLVRETLCWPKGRKWAQTMADTKARGFFGVPTHIIAEIWNRVEGDIESAARPKHLLWALALMKVYATEDVLCRIVGWPDPQTFHKWAWYFVKRIADLEDQVILLDN